MNNLIDSWRKINTSDNILNKGLDQSDKKIEDRFISKIVNTGNHFSAKMGAGLDRLNIHTVSAIAEAYALTLKKEFKFKNVLVGHDSRENSKFFATQISKVLSRHGIISTIFDNGDIYPMPLISFVIKKQNIDGGIVVSASDVAGDISGIKFLDENGSFLNKDVVGNIGKSVSKLDFLAVESQDAEYKYVPKSLINDYKKAITSIPLFKGESKIKVAFSTHHGMVRDLFAPILVEANTESVQTTSQNTLKLDFNDKAASKPTNEKSFIKALGLARKNKADLVLSFSQEGQRVGLATRHKKRYKFLNNNQVASLVLNQRINLIRNKGELDKNSYIITTLNSGDMPKRIAEKHGVRVFESNGKFQDIERIIGENGKEGFLLAFEETGGFVVDPNIAGCYDSIQVSIASIDIANELAHKGITLYNQYKVLEQEFGIYLNSKISKKLNVSSNKKLVKKILRLKKLGDHKVEEIIDYRNQGAPIIKTIFKNGSWVTFNMNASNSNIEIMVETFGKGGSNKLELFPFKREVQEWVKENSEEFLDKSFTKKGFFKYFTFSSIAIGILVFVFLFIYKSLGSNGSNKSLLQIAGWWADSPSSRWVWLTYWAWKAFTLFISAWMKKRMFQRLNEKVKTRHLMISAVMGSVIAFVTPFAVGGDAIGYWYLRRKKVKRSILIATLASSTLWGESKFAIQTILLVWIGWPVYQYIFGQDNPQAHAALIWFFIGLVWTVFSSFMILVLTLSKRFQEFVVKYSVIVLEWLPLIHIHNLEDKESDVQYEFFLIRSSMKKIWNKWWFVLEMMFYDLITLFFNPIVILMMCSGMINPQAPSGEYWTPIVTGDIVGTANSMSITPGGSGTGEWLGLVTKGVQYANTPLTKGANAMSVEQITAAQDIFYKLFIGWPFLIVSTSTIFITILTNRLKHTFVISNARLRIILVTVLSVGVIIYLGVIISGIWF